MKYYKKLFFLIIGLWFIACFSHTALAGNEADKEEVDLSRPEFVLKEAMDKLFNLIDTVEKEKGLSQAEKRTKIFNYIKNARWGPDKDNYFWVIDINGNTLGEPVCVNFEGKNINNYPIIEYKEKTDTEKRFADLIIKCKDEGQIFFQYLKPECKREKANLKIGLARLLVYKNWIVITGIYRDTIEAYDMPIEPEFFDIIDTIDDNEPASPI